MYRVFQKKMHKVCYVINFKPFVVELQSLHQNVIDKNICLVDKYSLLIGQKQLHVSSDITYL